MEKQPGIVTRRDFIRGTVGTTLGVSILGAKSVVAGNRSVRASTVIVVRDENVLDEGFAVDVRLLKEMVKETVIKVTSQSSEKAAWLSLVKTSDVVGLVPTPHLNPTHDELVDAVTAALVDAGVPSGNIVDAQGKDEVYKKCSALIALPGLKAHWLTGIGTVLKLYILYSGKPRDYHNQNSAKLGEIWNLPEVKGKTKLVLVDALYPLCDKGPQPDPRYKWAYNGLIAGTDPVAVETVCLRVLTEKRAAMRGEPWPLTPPPICIDAADEVYGLGTSRMDEITIQHFGWDEELLL